MTHPTPEDMMAHLYGENTAAQKAAIESHLECCGECRAQTAAWRGAMKSLDAWETGATGRKPSPERFIPMFRWAAAAAILIGAGFLAGRSLPPSAASIQAALRHEVAAQVAAALNTERATASQAISAETRRVLTEFAEQLDERRHADAEVIYTALRQIDDRHTRSAEKLRKDLSTVAVVADARLEDAQEQILQLANATPPKN